MEKVDEESKINISGLSGKGLIIELFLTNYCTYNCEHCMYDSGSHQSKEYMSDEILAKVKKQVDFLKQINMKVCINLIGGEPTNDFDKFSHILKEVKSWNVSVSMSTNGWWLSSRKNIERFFDIVSPYVNEDGKSHFQYEKNNGFTIRISEDPFHYEKRKIKDVQSSLNDIFSDYKLLSKSNVPIPHPEDPWLWKQYLIYDETGFDSYYISPNGRGKNVSNIKQWIEKYSKDGNFCFYNFNRIENIHYQVDGSITDTCGYGSLYEFGTVDDNLVYILELIWQYKKDRWQNKNNQAFGCWNCREMVQEWKEKNLERYREFFSSMNTFDMSKFLTNF
jgi:organic radical activating enzyme